MKRIVTLLLPALLVCSAGNILFAQGTAFTYQGRLNDNGALATGKYDLVFSLFDVASGDSALTTPVTNTLTSVTNGLFTVIVDFGDVFDGSERWLQIQVRTNGDTGSYATLSPRQKLTATPYSIRSGNAASATTAVTITGSLPSSGLSGNYTNTISFGSISNSFTGFFYGNGAGLTNVPGGFLVWRIYDSTNLFALANTGYLLTSSNFVNVTLPDSPNISDLVRVAGIGPGGWKISCQSGQSYFVNNLAGAIGSSWRPVAFSNNWYSIASSADGSKLYAANGSGAWIYSSVDSGDTWNLLKNGIPAYSLASSSDGSHLLAGASPSQLLWTSLDSGANWIARTDPGNGNWLSVASSETGNRLAACSFNGLIWTSVNYGTNWSNHASSSGTHTWYSIASSADGMRLVAVVTNGYIYTSVNAGTNWIQRAASRAWHGVASSSDGTKLAACVYGGQIWTSADAGTNWIPRESTRNWSSIASSTDGTKLVAGVVGGGIYASGDSGQSWTTHSPTTNWWSIATSSDGTKLAAGPRTGYLHVSGPSVNVTTTGYITGGQGSAVELLSVGDGRFVPISFMGQIFAY